MAKIGGRIEENGKKYTYAATAEIKTLRVCNVLIFAPAAYRVDSSPIHTTLDSATIKTRPEIQK